MSVHLIVFWRKAECVILHGVVGADGDIRPDPDHPHHHHDQQHQGHDVFIIVSPVFYAEPVGILYIYFLYC